MEPKKQTAHKCDGCVWRCYTGSDTILCSFPECRREEYRRFMELKRGARREAEKDNRAQ